MFLFMGRAIYVSADEETYYMSNNAYTAVAGMATADAANVGSDVGQTGEYVLCGYGGDHDDVDPATGISAPFTETEQVGLA